MSIVDNRKAFHDYFIEERFEAGMVLEGWEVKSIRAGRINLKEGYVIIRKAELFLFGADISKLIGKVERAGYTLVPLNLHFSKGRIKCEIGLAKGKKQHDKRATERVRDTQRAIQS